MKKRWIALWLMIALVFATLVGCGGSAVQQTADGPAVTLESAPDTLESVSDSAYAEGAGATADQKLDETGSYAQDSSSSGSQGTGSEGSGTGKTGSDGESVHTVTESYPDEDSQYDIDEDGSYTSKEDVALYLHIYGHLPDNFMTKKEARKLGWQGGSLEQYAPGMCIGGDYFGNYEGLLPDGNYHECDIDTLGRKSRGAKRIIYSDDGRIYYTDDHYESFDLLYGEE